MEVFTVNISGKVREAVLRGRPHLVAPLSLIVPGVLNGSKGGLLYTQEELGRNPGAWNEIPIVVYHPQVDGRDVSASTDGVLETQGVGVVLHASSNGKLVAEGWFDIENTRRIDPRVLNALEQGLTMEVSTGLFLDSEKAPDGATHNGTPFAFVARNFRPDHLAVLPDQTGACSVQDGCGLMVHKTKFFKEETEMSELTANERGALISGLISNCDCWNKDDQKTLEAFSNEKLKKLTDHVAEVKDQQAVANAAMQGFEDQQGTNHVFNSTTQKWESKPKKEEPVVNKEGEEGEKPKIPQTEEDWLAAAPDSVKNTFHYAKGIEDREKSELIGKILVNTKDETLKAAARKVYEPMTVDQLRAVVSAMPPQQTEPAPAMNYSGAAAATGTLGNEPTFNKEDILPLPSIDWSESTEKVS